MKENKLILQTEFYGQQDTELSDTCFTELSDTCLRETQSEKAIHSLQDKKSLKMIWNHNFVPAGSISKQIVFSYPGNEVIEAIKNTKQNRDGLYKYNIDRHQEL